MTPPSAATGSSGTTSSWPSLPGAAVRLRPGEPRGPARAGRSLQTLDADAVAARVLGAIEGLVGATDQGIDVPAVLGEGGDADADGHSDRDSVVDDRRLLDGPADSLGRAARLFRGPLGKISDELLPPVAPRHVLATQRLADEPADL